jgi:hypothetical protein
LGALARALVLADDPTEAAVTLNRALDLMGGQNLEGAAMAGLHKALVEVRNVQHAIQTGQRDAAREALVQTDIHPTWGATGLDPSLRLGGRLLDQVVAHARQMLSGWLLDSSGLWFESPDGQRVGLDRRHTLARILAALIARWRDAPGQPIEAGVLLEAGWPAVRIHPDSASLRLRVAISTLRKLGLAPILAYDQGGYFIRSDVAVVITAPP